MYNKYIFHHICFLLYIEDDDDDDVVTTWPHDDDEFTQWWRVHTMMTERRRRKHTTTMMQRRDHLIRHNNVWYTIHDTTMRRDDKQPHNATIIHNKMTRTIHDTTIQRRHDTQRCDDPRHAPLLMTRPHDEPTTRLEDIKTQRSDDTTMSWTRQEDATIWQRDNAKHNDTTDTRRQHPVVCNYTTNQQYHFTHNM